MALSVGKLSNRCFEGQLFLFSMLFSYYGNIHACAKKKALCRKSEYLDTLSGEAKRAIALIRGNSVDP